jgi:hypothetical protein
MQNSLKTGLLIAGIVLVGFGLFTVYSTNPEINERPIPLMKIVKSMDIESKVLIGIGIVAFLGGLIFKNNNTSS